MPYGVTEEPWDRQISYNEIVNYLKQCDAVQQADSYVVILWHKVKDAALVEDAMKNRHLQQVQNFFWYKEGQYSAVPTGQYGLACEIGSVGCHPDAGKAPQCLPTDPRKRHNFFSCPSVTSLYQKGVGGPINPCQKPIELSRRLIANHCPPGGNVLVIGFGAGGEVEGAIAAGCNVVGVEYDLAQFNAFTAHVIRKEESAIREEERLKLLEAKARNAPFSSNNPVDSPLANTSASLGTTTQEQKNLKCSECDAEVLIAEGESYSMCSSCKTGRPLHPNCLVTHEGDIYCLSCNQALMLSDIDQENSDIE